MDDYGWNAVQRLEDDFGAIWLERIVQIWQCGMVIMSKSGEIFAHLIEY